MANEYKEFLRNFSDSYILVRTTSSEVLRPFYVRVQGERGLPDETVSGFLLHEASGKDKKTGKYVSHVGHDFKWSYLSNYTVCAPPESMGVNLPECAAYLNFVPRRQFCKGWASKMFTVYVLGGGLAQRPGSDVSFDSYPDVTFFALTDPKNFVDFPQALKEIENGDRVSTAFSRNFAVGWSKGVSLPILYHRGQAKGLFLDSKTIEVSEECMKFKDLFNIKYNVALKPTDAKAEKPAFGQASIQDDVPRPPQEWQMAQWPIADDIINEVAPPRPGRNIALEVEQERREAEQAFRAANPTQVYEDEFTRLLGAARDDRHQRARVAARTGAGRPFNRRPWPGLGGPPQDWARGGGAGDNGNG
jgi:hypothetical protein